MFTVQSQTNGTLNYKKKTTFTQKVGGNLICNAILVKNQLEMCKTKWNAQINNLVK